MRVIVDPATPARAASARTLSPHDPFVLLTNEAASTSVSTDAYSDCRHPRMGPAEIARNLNAHGTPRPLGCARWQSDTAQLLGLAAGSAAAGGSADRAIKATTVRATHDETPPRPQPAFSEPARRGEWQARRREGPVHRGRRDDGGCERGVRAAR